MPEGNVPIPLETHQTVEQARSVLRLLAHNPDEFEIEVERGSLGPDAHLAALLVTRRRTGLRRSYELNAAADWSFELETDLKGGFFGPA